MSATVGIQYPHPDEFYEGPLSAEISDVLEALVHMRDCKTEYCDRCEMEWKEAFAALEKLDAHIRTCDALLEVPLKEA